MASFEAEPGSAPAAIDFLSLVGGCKVQKRTGWVDHAVHQPESISDHMYRMALASILAPVTGADPVHCMRIAIAHDLAEAITGDYTPHAKITKAEKHKLEQESMQQIQASLGPANQHLFEPLMKAWQEYESCSTPEARFVKDMDKLDMVLQALEYEKAQPHIRGKLDTFYDSVRGKTFSPFATACVREVERRRLELLEQEGESDGHVAHADGKAAVAGNEWRVRLCFAGIGLVIGAGLVHVLTR